MINLSKATSFSVLRRSMRGAAYIACTIAMLLLFGLHFEIWLLDLGVSFAPQVVILLLTLFLYISMCFVYCAVRAENYLKRRANRKDTMLVLVSFLLLFLVSWNVFYRGLVTGSPDVLVRNRLVVGTFNMLYKNDDTSRIAQAIREESASIIGFQEILPEEVEHIRHAVGYQYSFITDTDVSAHETEIALISKYPIVKAEQLFGYENGGLVRAEVLVNGQTIIFYIAHITPPYSNKDFNQRGAIFDAAATYINKESHPVFMVGDFNTVVYSKQLHDFKSEVKQHMYLASNRDLPECSWFGFGKALCLRIDHILVPKTSTVLHERIGSHAGSDHRPVFVEVGY